MSPKIATAGGIAATGAILLAIVLSGSGRVHDVAKLNGCYEADGLPRPLRPLKRWAFKLANGAVIDRSGRTISHVTLGEDTPKSTQIFFTPGISLIDDDQKYLFAKQGNIISGWAQTEGWGVSMSLDADLRSPVQSTSCG